MTGAATQPVAAQEASAVRGRAMWGAIWTTCGYGAQQVLRLASNLVLTRLLAPEAFGLMSLIFVFITGLELLSDVGVGPAIIHSKRGDDPVLLDTAWTIQIIRGFVLTAGALAFAWPAAIAYHQPLLAPLLCVAGLGTAIRGFTPTRVHTLNRKMLLGRVTAMEISSQAITIFATIAAAAVLRSVWGLLVGTLVGDLVRVALAYVMLPGHSHRLRLDRAAVAEFVHVGRWIFLGTAVTFAVGNLDRLVLGQLMTVTELGVYAIAHQLLQSVINIGRMIGTRVVFPLLAETARASPELLRLRLRRARTIWIWPTVSVLLVLALAGDWVIKLLYTRAYADAGWMLRILSAGYIVGVVNQSRGVVWQAIGEFRTSTLLLVAQVVVLLGAMIVGHTLGGIMGFVVAVAAVEPVMYPIQSLLLGRRRLWQPDVDLPVLATGIAVIAIGALLR